MSKSGLVVLVASIVSGTVLVIGGLVAGDAGIGRASAALTAIGLVLSVYVAVAVSSIKARYSEQGLLKEYHRRLQGCETNLKTAISRKNAIAAKKQLARIRNIFEEARSKSTSQTERNWRVAELDNLLELHEATLLAGSEEVVVWVDDCMNYMELRLAEIEWDHRDA